MTGFGISSVGPSGSATRGKLKECRQPFHYCQGNAKSRVLRRDQSLIHVGNAYRTFIGTPLIRLPLINPMGDARKLLKRIVGAVWRRCNNCRDYLAWNECTVKWKGWGRKRFGVFYSIIQHSCERQRKSMKIGRSRGRGTTPAQVRCVPRANLHKMRDRAGV
jgi:hypothetical protein